MNYHECVESETRSGSDDDGSDGRPFYGLKLRAADPRYVTHGDILLILAEVRELLIKKQQSGYKGRESQRPISSASNITICYKYSSRSWRWGRKGPAGQGCLAGISTFASMVGQNQQDNGPEGDNTRAQACSDANTHTNASRQFTRIVQRKNLPWEKDSSAHPGL